MRTVYTTLRAGLLAGLEAGEITTDEAQLADLWLDITENTTTDETP